MNGGAWLEIGGEPVDVLLRDLTAVEHRTARAERGEFEVDALLGYTAGVPAYLLRSRSASGTPMLEKKKVLSAEKTMVSAPSASAIVRTATAKAALWRAMKRSPASRASERRA
jgi:hypothetical protein